MNAVEFMTTRQNPMIDPIFHIWGWEIPVYLFLGGLVAGLMIVGAFHERFYKDLWSRKLTFFVPLFGMIFLSIGMFALFLDLEHKIYVFRFYLAFRPLSPMSWGAWILILAYPAMFLWMLQGIDDSFFNESNSKIVGLLGKLRSFAVEHKNFISNLNIGVGISLGIYTGILLSNMISRIVWHSALLGPIFLLSGISAGAAFLMFFKTNEKLNKMFIKWDVAALVVEFVFLTLFLISYLSGTALQIKIAKMFLFGKYSGTFFSIVIFGGILIPLGLEIMNVKGKGVHTYLIPILVLIGGITLRFVLVYAGQAVGFNFFH